MALSLLNKFPKPLLLRLHFHTRPLAASGRLKPTNKAEIAIRYIFSHVVKPPLLPSIGYYTQNFMADLILGHHDVHTFQQESP